MMKMYLYLDAYRLDFFHHFYSANTVSGVRFQVSGQPLACKAASLINRRNFKNQILDFGMRILDLRYSVHFKKTERSDSNIRHSTFVIRHSLKFHTRCQKRQRYSSILTLNDM